MTKPYTPDVARMLRQAKQADLRHKKRMEELRRPRPAINWAALNAEREARQKEAELIRKLGLQLIDIGYKLLATKLHPDKPGGSTEAMSRLNNVRTLLRSAR